MRKFLSLSTKRKPLQHMEKGRVITRESMRELAEEVKRRGRGLLNTERQTPR